MCLYVIVVLGFVLPSALGGDNDQCLFRPPFVGETRALGTSLPGVYESVTCGWDQPEGTYWWSAPFKADAPRNPIYGGTSVAGGAEVGQGWWLVPPTVRVEEASATWTSTAFIADRVPMYNHTNCCCQYIVGDDHAHTFVVTTFCRAIVTGHEQPAIQQCAPYAVEACPPDLAAAHGATWPMPSYSERYSSCTKPLGTVLPPTPPILELADTISATRVKGTTPSQQPTRALGLAAAVLGMAAFALASVRSQAKLSVQAWRPQVVLCEQLLSA